MAANKKKQDEKHLKILRDLVTLQHNKQCFDCQQRGPTCINMTIGSFVCTACSGILRGISPAHRVKSISMASFTADEIDFIKSHGNEFCRQVWLGLHDSRSLAQPESREEQKVKDFISQKYEKKRWYIAPTEAMKQEARQLNDALLSSKQSSTNDRSSYKLKLAGGNAPKINFNPPTQSAVPKPAAVPALIGGDSFVGDTAANKPPMTAGAAAKQSPAMDLLGDLSFDPFGSGAIDQPQTNAGPTPSSDFSNFASFNSGVPLSASNNPLVFGVTASTSSSLTTTPLSLTQASQNNTTSATDKYAALLNIDDVTPSVAAPSTNTGGLNWSGMGGSLSTVPTPMNWNSQTVNWDNPGSVSWDSSTATGSSLGGNPTTPWSNTSAQNSTAMFSQNTGMNPFSATANQPPQAIPAMGNPFASAPSSMFTTSMFPTQQNNVWPNQTTFNQATPFQTQVPNQLSGQTFTGQFMPQNSFATQNGSNHQAVMASGQINSKGVDAPFGLSSTGWIPTAPPGNPFMNPALSQQQQQLTAPRNPTNPFL